MIYIDMPKLSFLLPQQELEHVDKNVKVLAQTFHSLSMLALPSVTGSSLYVRRSHTGSVWRKAKSASRFLIVLV